MAEIVLVKNVPDGKMCHYKDEDGYEDCGFLDIYGTFCDIFGAPLKSKGHLSKKCPQCRAAEVKEGIRETNKINI